MSWREGWGLAQELLNDPTSRVFASVAGFSYAPSEVERIGIDLFEGWLNSQRKKGTVPIVLKRPWKSGAAGSKPDLVAADDPERLEAIARLERLTVEGPEMPEQSVSSE